MYFASGAFDPLQWTSVVSFSRRWADKSPEPVMWFHYSVIILYSSSRPTPLSSARNDNKSNQQECSSLREKQHKQRVREKKNFLFLLSLFTVSASLWLLTSYLCRVVCVCSGFITLICCCCCCCFCFISFFCFSFWGLVKRSWFACLDEFFNRGCAANNNC